VDSLGLERFALFGVSQGAAVAVAPWGLTRKGGSNGSVWDAPLKPWLMGTPPVASVLACKCPLSASFRLVLQIGNDEINLGVA
jgi:hypothetical protein